MTFREFTRLDEVKKIDTRSINQVYDKSEIAVELVQRWRPQLFDTVSAVVNLGTNSVYGLFSSAKARKYLPQDLHDRLIYYGKVDDNAINRIPEYILVKYLSQHWKDHNPAQFSQAIQEGNVVEVNINKHLLQSRTHWDAVVGIGSTIAHEITHSQAWEQSGYEGEVWSENAEKEFMEWAEAHREEILSKYPGLAQERDMGLPGMRNPVTRLAMNR